MPRDLLAKRQPRDLLSIGSSEQEDIRLKLPGRTRTEEKIAQRPDLFGEFLKETATIPPQKMFTGMPAFDIGRRGPKQTGKDLMNLVRFTGGAVQRGEAAIANPTMALQEGRVNPGQLAQEAWKGISGERLGELGDIGRRSGWPEPLAATAGMLATIGIGNLATKGKLVKNINQAKDVIGEHLPQVMDKNYVMRRTEDGVKLLKEVRKTLGEEVGAAVKKAGDVPVDAQKLSQQLPQLPQRVINALDDPIYKIEKLPDGSFKPTVGNLHQIKEALDDFMTSQAWEEAGKMSQRMIKQAYGVIRNAMTDAASELKKPLKDYSNFMGLYRNAIKTLQDTSGRLLEKKLRNTFARGAERQYQIAWEKLAELYPKAGQIMKDVVKYNQRQTAKKWAGRAALVGGGYELGRRLTRPLVNAISEMGGGESEGGG